jgi:choline-glycine betaine transporter
MTVLVMLLVAIFFVSGADAASIVMGSLSERGTLSPSRKIVVFWGVVMGAVAAIMLLVGGDDALTGLQNLTIIAALPFALVMVGLAVSLAKDLRSDPMVLRRAFATEAVEQAVVDGITRHGEDFQLVVEPASEVPAEPNRVAPLPVEDEVPAGRPQDPRD